MFGANPVLKREDHLGLVLNVHEIFYTIQGEGPHAGLPAVFIRLFGCHLKCSWCDTDFSNKNLMTIDKIISRVQGLDKNYPSLIVLTGGEPTRQPIDALVTKLLDNDHRVQIETAGSFYRDCMRVCDVVVSPKTSFVDYEVASHAAAFKYVISADMTLDSDGLPITDTQGRNRVKALFKPPEGFPKSMIFLSPMDEYNVDKNKANLIKVAKLAMKHGYRMGVQMHKLVDLP
jgi:7-carboxy-7-deazaguanine synthase